MSEEFASPSPASRRPSVSVLITCYNYGRFLKQCVASVLTQEGVDVRVIIIDDASTDDSAEIAALLARQDSRIKLIALQENVGMIPAVNCGLRYVDSDYFVKLDADDLLSAGSLKRSVALLEAHLNVGFVYGKAYHFRGDAPRCASTGHRRWTVGALFEWLIIRGCPTSTIWEGQDWLAIRYRRGHNCIRQPEAVIRYSVLKSVGDYNPKLRHTSDLEMWLRLAAVSDVARINRCDQGYYRVHPDSMQHTANAGLLTDLIGRREAFLSEALTNSGEGLADANLVNVVRKELSAQALVAAQAELDLKVTNHALVDQLAEFAVATFPSVVTSRQWKKLEHRRSGRWRGRWFHLAPISSMFRYLRHEFSYLRWLRTGT